MARTLSLLLVMAAVACGGAVSLDDSNGTPGTGGRTGSAGARPDAGVSGSGGSGGSSAQDAGYDVYVDPGCPELPPEPPDIQCDPFAEPSGCGFDEGCYPYVDYPSGARCGSERYGTMCLPVGSGQQGDDCEETRCGAGFVCVVGGAPGATCVQLCSTFGEDNCPAGLWCLPIDIQQGYGGCF